MCRLLIFAYSLGTHDVIATAVITETSSIAILTSYFSHSSASGALYILYLMPNGEDVDLSTLSHLLIERNVSHYYELPFSLISGEYQLLIYDIAHNGMISDGIVYPAIVVEFQISRNIQGTNLTCLIFC